MTKTSSPTMAMTTRTRRSLELVLTRARSSAQTRRTCRSPRHRRRALRAVASRATSHASVRTSKSSSGKGRVRVRRPRRSCAEATPKVPPSVMDAVPTHSPRPRPSCAASTTHAPVITSCMAAPRPSDCRATGVYGAAMTFSKVSRSATSSAPMNLQPTSRANTAATRLPSSPPACPSTSDADFY